MKASLLCAVACAACASAPLREPSCTAPANRVEIQHVQVGWQRQDPTIQSPVVDPRVPTRDPRQAEDLARNLLDECRSGTAMEPLQDRYSEVPGGSIVVGARSNVPFRAAALCMRKNECAVVRSNVAFHVLKRID
ncbi:MAG: hypothetical protein E6J82_09030 [Deltaproteobacteria bacterium]|nr:MAG: hypothetical protein E6J82_09030 [Deltaproteobacteria bacterium]